MATRARRGRRVNRKRFGGLVEVIAQVDPAAEAELMELRRHNPQAYRKALRKLIRAGVSAPFLEGHASLPINETRGPRPAPEPAEVAAAAARAEARVEQTSRAREALSAGEKARRVLEELRARRSAAPGPSRAELAPDRAAVPVAKLPETPAKSAKSAAPEASLAILDGAVKAVSESLSSGAHDAHLAVLLATEESGRARPGVLKAIRARMATKGG